MEVMQQTYAFIGQTLILFLSPVRMVLKMIRLVKVKKDLTGAH